MLNSDTDLAGLRPPDKVVSREQNAAGSSGDLGLRRRAIPPETIPPGARLPLNMFIFCLNFKLLSTFCLAL